VNRSAVQALRMNSIMERWIQYGGEFGA